MTRITQQSLTNNVMSGLQYQLDEMQQLQAKLSSGKTVSRPSDGPAVAMSAMRLRAEVGRAEQYARNSQDGQAYVGVIDKTLTTGLDMIQRVRQLAVQAANSGAGDVQARNAIADELAQLKQALLGVANTTYLDRSLFAGTSGTAQSYDVSGHYLGDSGVIERTVARGVEVQINVTGPDVFGTDAGVPPTSPPSQPYPASTQLFETLDNLIFDVRNDPAKLRDDTANLDVARQRVQDVLGLVGARSNRLDTMLKAAVDGQDTATKNLSDVEDVDLPQVIMKLQMQQTSYQAALSATAKVIQPSLVEFLR